MSLTRARASLGGMTGSAYRELERCLTRTLQAFDATRQKLNGFERACRDRAAVLLGEIITRRKDREAMHASSDSKSVQ